MSFLQRGMKFTPSDEVLITSYLLKRTRGYPLPWNGILYAPVYVMDPWDAFNHIINMDSSYWKKSVSWFEEGRLKNKTLTIYVFTEQTKSSGGRVSRTKSSGGRVSRTKSGGRVSRTKSGGRVSRTKAGGRVSRTAGLGTWKGQSGPKYITSSRNGQIIGYSRSYTFTMPEGVTPPEEYKSHKWVMHEYCLDGINGESDTVLCKIKVSCEGQTNVQIPRGNTRVLGSTTGNPPEDDVHPVQMEQEEDVQIPTERPAEVSMSLSKERPEGQSSNQFSQHPVRGVKVFPVSLFELLDVFY